MADYRPTSDQYRRLAEGLLQSVIDASIDKKQDLSRTALNGYGLTPQNPVAKETNDIKTAQRLGLTRAEYMRINVLALTICRNSATVCYQRVLKTGEEDPNVSRDQIDFSQLACLCSLTNEVLSYDRNRCKGARPRSGADAADVAMRALTHLFSSRRIIERAHFRCGMGGPTDFDVFFESALDQAFGQNPSSHYKCWVRRLHNLV
jgi:hypothetical protein